MLGWTLVAGIVVGYEAAALKVGAETLSAAARRLRDHPQLGFLLPTALAGLAWHLVAQGRA